MAAVRLANKVFTDQRYDHLARMIGCSRYEVIGRMVYLWSQCTEMCSYTLSESFVEMHVDPSMLVAAGLAERVPEGLRIRGTEGNIEWLEKNRQNSKKAVAARKSREPIGQPNGYPNGHPIGEPFGQPIGQIVANNTNTLPIGQPIDEPIGQPIGVPIGVPIEEEEEERSGSSFSQTNRESAYNPFERGDRLKLARDTWHAIRQARSEIIAELKLADRPMPELSPASSGIGQRNLLQRIEEEGSLAPLTCKHVVAARTAEARKTKSVAWLGDRTFDEKPWRNARDMKIQSSAAAPSKAHDPFLTRERYEDSTESPHTKLHYRGTEFLGCVFALPDGTYATLGADDDVQALEAKHWAGAA